MQAPYYGTVNQTGSLKTGLALRTARPVNRLTVNIPIGKTGVRLPAVRYHSCSRKNPALNQRYQSVRRTVRNSREKALWRIRISFDSTKNPASVNAFASVILAFSELTFVNFDNLSGPPMGSESRSSTTEQTSRQKL